MKFNLYHKILYWIIVILVFGLGTYQSYVTDDWSIIGSMIMTFSICFILGRLSR